MTAEDKIEEKRNKRIKKTKEGLPGQQD